MLNLLRRANGREALLDIGSGDGRIVIGMTNLPDALGHFHVG